MIGVIKKLFSGILSFLFGLFGGKKSEGKLPANNTKSRKSKGYFLELDESEEQSPANGSNPAKAVAAKTSQVVAAASAKAEKTAAKTSQVVGALTPDKAEKTEPAKTSQPAAAAPAKAEKTEAANNNQPAPKVELVQTAEGVKAEPSKPAKAPAASTNGQATTETTFAPKYLNPANSSNGRRRPGPNMNTFLDMARQVKPSS
jgi:DNA polymerase III gamma/tau subunit